MGSKLASPCWSRPWPPTCCLYPPKGRAMDSRGDRGSNRHRFFVVTELPLEGLTHVFPDGRQRECTKVWMQKSRLPSSYPLKHMPAISSSLSMLSRKRWISDICGRSWSDLPLLRLSEGPGFTDRPCCRIVVTKPTCKQHQKSTTIRTKTTLKLSNPTKHLSEIQKRPPRTSPQNQNPPKNTKINKKTHLKQQNNLPKTNRKPL